MIKLGFGLLLLCWVEIISAQQNLVPNYSFEEYISCPDCLNVSGASQGFGLMYWSALLPTPDYYNACGTSWGNIYTAYGGGGEANEGVAYIGLIASIPNYPWPEREYIHAKLVDSMSAGKRYICNFYVNLADSSKYATKNLGVFFSKTMLSFNNPIPEYYFQVIPQVKYNGDDFLVNDRKWILVTGSFIANGGETYISIGNFDDDSETQILQVPGGIGTVENWNLSYYYIDNVSVIEDTSYHPIGIEEELIKRIQVNYSNGQLQTEGLLFQNNNTAIELYSLSGSKIVALPLKKGNEKQNVNLDGLANGVYLYALKLNNEVVKRGKILIRD